MFSACMRERGISFLRVVAALGELTPHEGLGLARKAIPTSLRVGLSEDC